MSLWPLLLIVFPIWSFFGNLLVIVSVCRDKQLHTLTNFCVVNLAFADLLISITSWPLVIYVNVNDGRWYLGDDLCAFFTFFTGIVAFNASFTIVTISVDRLLAVRYPFIYRSISKRWVVCFLTMSWLLMVPPCLPGLFKINQLPDPTICGYFNGKYVALLSIFTFWLPLFVMIIAYCNIWSALKKRRLDKIKLQSQLSNESKTTSDLSSSLRSSASQTTDNKSSTTSRRRLCHSLDRKANRTMIVVVAVFLVCYAPLYLVSTAQWLAGEFPPTSQESLNLWNRLIIWASIAYILNSCWNVVIYSLFNSRLRKSFRRQIHLIARRVNV